MFGSALILTNILTAQNQKRKLKNFDITLLLHTEQRHFVLPLCSYSNSVLTTVSTVQINFLINVCIIYENIIRNN